MKTRKRYPGLCREILAIAVVAAFVPAHAEEGDEMAKLTKPESSISVGAGTVSGDSRDRARFGQYNDLRNRNGFGVLDFNLINRDDATGTWTIFEGFNLGLDTRELHFQQQQQGDWKYSADYDKSVRNYPNTINTALQGIGTNNLTVTRIPQGTGTDVNLKTERESVGLGLEKWLGSSWHFETSYKNEEKTGARIFGRGLVCNATATTAANGYGCVNAGATSPATAGVLLLLPEPIDFVMRTVDTKLTYSGEKLTLTGAYYGSFFTNKNGSLTQTFNGLLYNPNFSDLNPAVAGGNNLAGVGALGNPMSLQPDNQSNQLSLAGTYAITPTTRSTFKAAYTRNTQKEDFTSMGFTGAPRNSLGAVLDTTLLQVGVTSRPIQKFTILSNLRYEQRSDKTPVDLYGAPNPARPNTTNGLTSNTRISGKLEGSYQLPQSYRATIGVDVNYRDFGVPVVTNDTSGQSNALRQKTQEVGYRAELRRSMSETLTGAISVGHSYRSGSTWMTTAAGNGTQSDGQLQGTGFNLFPLLWANLSRDKLKLSTDWTATERLSLQFNAEASAEHYYVPSLRGARDGATRLLSMDAAYTVSENWKLTGYLSHGDQILDINGPLNSYSEGMRTLSNTLGLGVRGRLTSKFETGGDMMCSYETNRYAQGIVAGTSTQPNDLPAVAYRQMRLNLFGKYALEKNSEIRVDLVHQRYKTNEWFWSYAGTSFFYSDGTTVSQQAVQNVTMVKASYSYRFQ